MADITTTGTGTAAVVSPDAQAVVDQMVIMNGFLERITLVLEGNASKSDGGFTKAMAVNALKASGQLKAVVAEMKNPTDLLKI